MKPPCPVVELPAMSDAETDDPRRDVERLKAELARKEREFEELKRGSSRTKKVEDDLWSHEIYLRSRKKLAAGVIVVLAALSALGLVTVYELSERGLEYVDGKMKDSIKTRIESEAEKMIEEARTELDRQVAGKIAEAGVKLDEQVNQQIGTLVAAKRIEIDSLITTTEEAVKDKIAKLQKSLQEEGDAVSLRVREIRNAMQTSGEAVRAKQKVPQGGVACDPNNLDASQVALIGIRQLSTQIAQPVGAGPTHFRNTLFLDVRGNDEKDLANEACILDGVDRVVYRADPNWYSPSKFVHIDRETNFRFTITGWGPTKITAAVYFIGRRYPTRHEGNLSLSETTDSDERYLGDPPPDVL